jgi:hypothetical protein
MLVKIKTKTGSILICLFTVICSAQQPSLQHHFKAARRRHHSQNKLKTQHLGAKRQRQFARAKLSARKKRHQLHHY